jgi:hypothetical protein
MLFFHPMERGYLLSSKYVLLALANRKQLPAAAYTVHVYLLLALANKNTGIISATYSQLSLPRFKRDLSLNPE